MTSTLTAAPAVTVDGNLATVRFDRFDLSAYERFLACKRLPESQVSYDWRSDSYTLTTPARFAERIGGSATALPSERLPIAPHLFDYQAWVVGLALDAKRFAAWLDTGLGKGPVILEWSRQVLALTGANVLILEPLGIIGQLCEEARRFYGDALPIRRLESRADLIAWLQAPGCELAITNDEKFVDGPIPELRLLGGLAYDESSRLKSGGGVIKWNLIKSARGIEYKLSATATPAPNEAMEYASQAAFLEKLRTEGEILWTYFARDNKTNEWRVKPHARQALYAFMASWSVYLRDPARFGFRDILADLPPPDVREYELPLHPVQREIMHGLLGPKAGLFNDDRLTLSERSRLAQLARGFLYDSSGGKRRAVRYPSAKPERVAELVTGHVEAGRQTIVWTVFDEEGEIIRELLPETVEAAMLSGKQSDADREALIRSFKSGALPVLISKPQLLGYGLNFQNCRAMVFSGIDDSFERLYQAVRRAVRYGQKHRVAVDIPVIPELEGTVFGNVMRKQQRFDEETAIQEEHYRRALIGDAA